MTSGPESEPAAESTSPQVRRLNGERATRLAGLSAIFDDLQAVLRCCELLLPVDEHVRRQGRDPVEQEALWTTALISYARCFTKDGHGVSLSQKDLDATALQGKVVEWHKMLMQLHRHFTDRGQNPRGQFSVGAAVREDGEVEAVAVTSTAPIALDEQTIRQTGAVALQLSKVVDERVGELQKEVMSDAAALPKSALEDLPLIEVTAGDGALPAS